jgi:hypothetical protein
MAARNSRRASDVDRYRAKQKRRRTSGRREGKVLVGHDKQGRPKYREIPEPEVAPEPATEYPNMAAQGDYEHAQHVLRGLQMGLTRKQAEAHARADERSK